LQAEPQWTDLHMTPPFCDAGASRLEQSKKEIRTHESFAAVLARPEFTTMAAFATQLKLIEPFSNGNIAMTIFAPTDDVSHH